MVGMEEVFWINTTVGISFPLPLCLINPPIFSLPTAPAISQPTKLFTKPPTPRVLSVVLAIVGLHQIAFVSHHTLMKHSCVVSSKEQQQLSLENNICQLPMHLVSSEDSWSEYLYNWTVNNTINFALHISRRGSNSYSELRMMAKWCVITNVYIDVSLSV